MLPLPGESQPLVRNNLLIFADGNVIALVLTFVGKACSDAISAADLQIRRHAQTLDLLRDSTIAPFAGDRSTLGKSIAARRVDDSSDDESQARRFPWLDYLASSGFSCCCSCFKYSSKRSKLPSQNLRYSSIHACACCIGAASSFNECTRPLRRRLTNPAFSKIRKCFENRRQRHGMRLRQIGHRSGHRKPDAPGYAAASDRPARQMCGSTGVENI